MNCPVCDEKLREVEKHGVSVDICPGCKGVWLDRGELEKIIELVSNDTGNSGVRAESALPAQDRPECRSDDGARRYPDREYSRDHDRDHDHDHERSRERDYEPKAEEYRRDPRDRQRRRGGVLGDIFEIFGGGD